MKLYLRGTEEFENFTTFELHNVDSILASKRFISDIESKRKFSDEVFAFIDEAYDELGGFRTFKDMDRFINDSYLWYITYDGPQPISDSDIDINRVFVVSVYRKNHGMKLVGIARRKIASGTSSRDENIRIRTKANSALIQHIKFMNRIGWAEISGKLETYFHNALGTNAIILPEELMKHNVFPNIELDTDEFHYLRPLRKDGPIIRKIAYGHIDWGKYE